MKATLRAFTALLSPQPEEAETVTYRDFARPPIAKRSCTVEEWMSWLDDEDVLAPTSPRPEASCELCGGAVGPYGDGGYWPRCAQCRNYSEALDEFVPISYSMSTGLESALHKFKDFENYGWLQAPLGALLYTFLDHHRECIENAVEGVDIATFVPADNRQRTFSPLQQVLDALTENPIEDWYSWDPGAIARDFATSRPRRGEEKPEAYVVKAISGMSVLLLDDTWTSGASMVSSAAALKQAGARAVIGLTLGRQLNIDGHFGSTDTIRASVSARAWRSTECLLCS
jgi:predicted amidophosphoribosyltransferase